MTDFIEALTRQLHGWQDETVWLTFDVVRQMLTQAANESVDEPATLRLYREIEPSELEPLIVLAVDSDYVLMDPEHVATLRALLMSFDEHAPPRIGEPLSIPAKLEDGRVISTVTKELLTEAK